LPHELIGKTIAKKFVIESFVGGGGMGAVYSARQVDLDKAPSQPPHNVPR
jgi:hypothetical protein